MDNLSFCNCCGSWVPPTTGTIQFGEGGKVVIVCDSCNKLSQASPQSPNTYPAGSQTGSEIMSAATSDPGELSAEYEGPDRKNAQVEPIKSKK